jgi:S1-C subfamily serine protease
MQALILALSLISPTPLQLQAVGDDPDRLFELRRTPIVRVAENASPAVVYIQIDGVTAQRNPWGQLQKRRISGSGSGVVILPEGFIVTNYHVVKNANSSITVSFNPKFDDRVYDAQLVSFVQDEDLALLKIPHERDFPTIPLGTSSDLMPGETVVAIGNPHGQTHSVSQGIISGLHRNVEIAVDSWRTLHFTDLIQTDASINLGNSGGPLLNIHGELIGINSVVNSAAENIGFAIPVDRVREVLDDQLLDPDIPIAFFGFDVSAVGRGELEISELLPGAPAQLAGLRLGDRVLGLQEQGVGNLEQYHRLRVCIDPAEEVDLEVDRNGRRQTVRVRPWDKIDGILYRTLGMTVETYSIGRSTLVRVDRIREDGPADRLGLLKGDVLYAAAFSMYRGEVENRSWLASMAVRLREGEEMELELYRDLDGDERFDASELHRGSLARD